MAIAIFTDAHAMLEPTKAALEDMKKRGITEIYSLGDNIGDGPNPSEVLNLLLEYNVKSIAGNAEEYITLGTEPFNSYFNTSKKKNCLWTLSKLNEEQIGQIKLFPHYIELSIGNKSLGLCHFANDVRIDFDERSTFSYQRNFDFYNTGDIISSNASTQFKYTNSPEQLEEIEYMIKKYGKNDPRVRGFLSAKDDPLFAGRRVDLYDAIIQGHVHWKLYDQDKKTKYYSIRAVGMAYRGDPLDTASYVILREKDNDFELEEVLVTYDRERMVSSILNCDNRETRMEIFAGITFDEISKYKR